MSDKILFENKEQRELYADFMQYLTLVNFALLIELKKNQDPDFDEKALKKELLEKWMSVQVEVSKEYLKEYVNSMNNNKLLSILGRDIEDTQHLINKNLTFVKKAITEILDI